MHRRDQPLKKETLGSLSILTFLISVVFFLIVRGPEASIGLAVIVFTVLSLLGIIFAIVSKNIWFMITGIVLNGAVLVAAYFLLLAIGISGA